MFRFLKELYEGSQLFMFLNCFIGASSQSRKNKDEEHNEKRTKNHTDSNKGVLRCIPFVMCTSCAWWSITVETDGVVTFFRKRLLVKTNQSGIV